MSILSNILSRSDIAGVYATFSAIDIAALIICAAGVCVFSAWLFGLWSTGTFALSPARPNSLPYAIPFLHVIIWIMLLVGASVIVTPYIEHSEEWLQQFADHMSMSVIELCLIFVYLYVARTTFVQGLKGFGLDKGTIVKDFFCSVLNFTAILPLMLLAISAVTYIGQIFGGPGFEMQVHEGLTMITGDAPWLFKLLVIFSATIVAPVFEELLFRGLIQSSLRSFTRKPWIAILITSALFALIHPYPTHWLALLVLSVGMGYSYERSGSLFRPIFIHIIFNTASITAAILS